MLPKKKMPPKKATHKGNKSDLFCKEYLIDLNATQAMIRAGYAAKTASVCGSKMLAKSNIRMRIESLMQERSKQTLVDADFVVKNLIEISQKCQSKVPVMIWNAEEKTMEQKMDADGNNVWEFDSSGANKALELLGRHLAMFTDKLKTTAVIEQPLF